MKQALIFLSLFLTIASSRLFAQESSYVQGFGATLYIGSVSDGMGSSEGFSTGGLHYAGRYNFMDIGEKSNLSVAFYPVVNISFSANSRSGGLRHIHDRCTGVPYV